MKLNIGDKVMVKARNDDPWWDLVEYGAPDGMIEVTVIGEPHTRDEYGFCVELKGPDCDQFVSVSAIKPIKKPFQLKDGKKYETADGVVYGPVRECDKDEYFDLSDDEVLLWRPDGTGVMNFDLIRRHYTKPQPAHKLDLKEGDVVELVKWEDGAEYAGNGKEFIAGDNGKLSHDWINFNQPKGERPLFKVVSRAYVDNAVQLIV